MSVHLRHLLIADTVLLDSLTGKASAIGLFDVINISPEKTSEIVNFSILGQLVFHELPKEKIDVLVNLSKPDGTSEKQVTLSLDAPPTETPVPLQIPLIVNFMGTEISQAGNYDITITVNGFAPEIQRVGTFQAVKVTAPAVEDHA